MKQRLASPSDVIDLGRINDLIGIEVSADSVTIKAATTHYDVAGSGPTQKAIPALAHLASLIGDPAVRYRGTIGGSIANNDPAADYPAAVLALGATIKTNKRSIAADDFFKGLFATALTDGEIVTQVAFPIPAKAGYSKFPHPASRFALTGVFVVKTKAEADKAQAAAEAAQNAEPTEQQPAAKSADKKAKANKGPQMPPDALVVRQAFVTTGPTRGDQVAILKGLDEGVEVVTSGQIKLKSGSPIRIDNSVQPANSPNPAPQEN